MYPYKRPDAKGHLQMPASHGFWTSVQFAASVVSAQSRLAATQRVASEASPESRLSPNRDDPVFAAA